MRSASLRVLAAAAALLIGGAGSGTAAEPRLEVVVLDPGPALKDREILNEPHLAVDPSRPSVLVAVAQTHSLVAWRSEDGGRTWAASRPLSGQTGRGGQAAGDPVVALGPDASALLGSLTFDLDGRCTLVNRVGSYRSADGGRTFGALAVAGATLRLPRVVFDRSVDGRCPPPKGLSFVSVNDKPWLAVDATSGVHRGAAYLAWTRYELYSSGRTFATLLFAASRDGGKTYGRPIVIAPRALRPDLLEQLSQVAVRPDGTVDLVWNDLRNGTTVVLNAASSDGGASFGPAEVVTALSRGTTPVGLVTSLATSAGGELAVCWSASIRPKSYLPRLGCSTSSGAGGWSTPVSPFANGGRQYLPAAVFQGERLWVAAYRSTAETTRVVLARSEDGGQTFAEPAVLAERNYGRAVLCAPHPPDCGPRQRFVGDYIGAVAVPGRVWVDFVLPAGGRASPNRVYVASLATD